MFKQMDFSRLPGLPSATVIERGGLTRARASQDWAVRVYFFDSSRRTTTILSGESAWYGPVIFHFANSYARDVRLLEKLILNLRWDFIIERDGCVALQVLYWQTE